MAMNLEMIAATENAREDYVMLLKRARRAYDAQLIQLPAKNHEGLPILNGDLSKIYHCMVAYLDASSALRRGLDWNFCDYVQYVHRYANGRFWPEDVFQEKFPHLFLEIEKSKKIYGEL